MHSKWFVVAIVAGLLSTGSVNTLVKKLAYDMTSVGRDGLVESFKKVPPRGPVGRRVREALLGGGWCRASPCAAVACACAAAALLLMLLLSQPWTLTLAMFLGETLCLLYWFLKVRRARSANGGKPAVAQPLLGPAASDPAAARAMADGASSVACGVCAFSLPGRMRSPPALVAWAGGVAGRAGRGVTEEDNDLTWRSALICVLPTACDLSGTTLCALRC